MLKTDYNCWSQAREEEEYNIAMILAAIDRFCKRQALQCHINLNFF